MNMFVCRVAKGHDGGVIGGQCPKNYKEHFDQNVKSDLEKQKKDSIPYATNNYIDYLHKELWNCGHLRQGWGVNGLSLLGTDSYETERHRWINNYILALKKFWDTDPLDPKSGYSENNPPCDEAAGRLNMLNEVLLRAKPKDIIFIPKHSCANHHDDDNFTVCEVVGPYYFDLNENYMDFGHVLSVRNLQTFTYNNYGIKAKDFQGQHQKAVSSIKENYKNHELFYDFIKSYYKRSL